MKKILITGGDGQLSFDLKNENNSKNFDLYFFNKNELDIRGIGKIKEIFSLINPDLIINTAAYTAVDLAEGNKIETYEINANGPKNIAIVCNQLEIPMIHISTDYVFDGKKNESYIETDNASPINYYGYTKLMGERNIINSLSKYLIIRAGWLCGLNGNNFVKTIINLSQNDNIKVVNDQKGTPTPTSIFAQDILEISKKFLNVRGEDFSGIYHYSCDPPVTWYDYAGKIIDYLFNKKYITSKPELIPIKTKEYNFTAERPKFSVLNNKKINNKFNLSSKKWETHVYKLIENMIDGR